MDRIVTTAETAGLGERGETQRVNADHEHHVFGPGILTLLAAAGLLAGHLAGGEELLLPTVIIAAIGLVIVVIGLPQHLRGIWLVHHFDHGIVMERTKGRVIAARYAQIRAELWTYQSPGDADSAAQDYLMLQLDFPRGERCVMAERDTDESWVLTRLGNQCGAGAPQPIDHETAEQLLNDHIWT
ncbi:hypothetical protein FB566_2298 [Stackebrandtia endophytica]|uniref:PH (Pleckstrin Homology) domain-containing protein n=1 Tax=Stackebrandtia endophytica TaxID=1496996 RepID=A0A543AW33_9ACTN|nr:hypothetical protein [Stackebrandtia endophytica]TQL76761.1 hypothetical protein FB566_2298 [Stackebrandtia endophytica]